MKAKLIIEIDDQYLQELGIGLEDLEVDYQVFIKGEHEFDRTLTWNTDVELEQEI